jgi:hypothetical protein
VYAVMIIADKINRSNTNEVKGLIAISLISEDH